MSTALRDGCLAPWVSVVRELVRELGAVCRELRKAAGLDIEHDLHYFTRADARTIEAFENGTGGERILVKLLEGYAQAVHTTREEIEATALRRVQGRDNGQP
jgi:hypothetical protein